MIASTGAAHQAPAAVNAPAGAVRMTWAQPQDMTALSFVNAGLKIITLGIYQFWGKTEVRKRIWTAVRIDGEPLEYTGTGKELFKGFVFVFGAVLLPMLLISLGLTAAFGPAGQGAAQIIVFLLYVYLFGMGVYRAQRYRLTRTRWRGIRGSLAGSSTTYAWTTLWTALLIPVTLGWIYPWRAARLQRLIVENMRFGDRAFQFEENSGPLYGRFIALWLGGLAAAVVGSVGMATIAASESVQRTARETAHLTPRGVVMMLALLFVIYLAWLFASSWYRAGQFNAFARATTFEGAQFNGTMTGSGLLWLSVSNVLIVIASLGILSPIAQARAARYFIAHLSLEGAVDLTQIAQAGAARETRGEGLAQAFDFDAF